MWMQKNTLFCILKRALRGQHKTLKQKEVELCLVGKVAYQLKKGNAWARPGQEIILLPEVQLMPF